MKINFLAALPFLMVAAIPLALSPANAATNAATRAKSSPPEIQAGLDGGGSGFLSLNWNEPVVTRSEWANQELTLRFNRPLADAPIAEARFAAGGCGRNSPLWLRQYASAAFPRFRAPCRDHRNRRGRHPSAGPPRSLAARPISPGSISSGPRRCWHPARSLRPGPSCSVSSPMCRFLRISRVPPGRRGSKAAAATCGAAFRHSTGCCAPIPAIPSCSPITRLY